MKRVIPVLLMISSACFHCLGQKQLKEEVNHFRLDENLVFLQTDELVGGLWQTSWQFSYECRGDICYGYRYGLVSDRGDTIPPFFSSLEVLPDSLILLKREHRAILINESLVIVAPFEHMFPLHNGDLAVSKNNRWGTADNRMQVKTGLRYDSLKQMMPFIEFDDEDESWGGERKIYYLPAKLNGRWGLINYEKDSSTIPFEYSFVDFSPNDIYVIDQNGKHGILTVDNKVVIPVQYDSVSSASFSSIVKKEGKWAFYQEPLEFKYTQITHPTIQHCRCLKSPAGWIMINGSGKQITDTTYEDIMDYRMEITPMKLNGKWGFVDCIKEKAVSEFIYDSVEGLYEDSAEVTSSGETKVIYFSEN